MTYSSSQGVHVYKDGDLIITDGALKWGGQNLAKLTIGACDDGDIPLAGTILHSMKIYAAKLSEADVGLETERSDYASLSWVASFDGNNSMVGWITNWDGESTLAYINTPNAQGGVIASGCHPYKGYTFNQPFTIALYANIADVDVGTAANGAALIALGKPGESNQGAGNLVLAKTAVDKVALSRSGTKLVEITDEDLAAADSYHLFVFGMDAEGNTFLSVDGEKKQSESPTTYPEAGLQIGSMYTGIGSYIQAYGMIVDEIRGYSAYLNDDDLAKLATRFPAESRSISDSSLMYNWTGKNSGKLYTLSSPVVMPSADITSFTATVQYKNGNSRIEIAGVKLVDGEGNEFIGATNGDGASFTGGNSGNNVYTFTNNAGFSGDFYTLYATLWVNGSTGTGHITLSEGVTFNDLFTESETGSIIMPAQRLSANEGNVTIPSGFALTVQGGDSEVEIAKVITVDGSLTTMGALNFSAANRVAAGGTLEVATGETKFNLAGSGFSGKLKVASGATFKNGTNDGPNYNGAPVLDIAGTLEVTETARWSLGVNSQTILRDGAVLKGAGGTGYDYAFDYFNGATITVDGNATIEGNIGAHLAQSKVITLNVAEGKTLTIAGSVKAGTIAATGAGTVRLTAANAYTGGTTIGAGATLELDGGSLGTGAVTVADGATIAGSGTIGGTLTLVAGSTVDATDGSLTVNGDVTLPGEGEVTVKVAETAEAGDTVITCANAEAVAAALTGAPEGLRYVAENGAVKLAAATVTVTLPAAPENMVWFYDGQPVENNAVTVNSGTSVTVTLKPAIDYIFSDNTTEKTFDLGEVTGDITGEIDIEDIVAVKPEVKIGEKSYATFASALAAAADGDTIVLEKDVICTEKPVFNNGGVVNVDVRDYVFVSTEQARVRNVASADGTVPSNNIKFVSGFGWEVYAPNTTEGVNFRVFPTLDAVIAYEPATPNPARIFPYENVKQEKDVVLRKYGHGTSSTICIDPEYDITWDLNGYTVHQESPTGNPLEACVRGKFTLKDSSAEQTGKWIAGACGVTDPGNTTWYGNGGPALYVLDEGELILEGGTISIARNATSDTAGNEIVNSGGLIRVDSGKLDVNGATLQVDDTYGIMAWGGEVVVNGGIFDIDPEVSTPICALGYYEDVAVEINAPIEGELCVYGNVSGYKASATVNVAGVKYAVGDGLVTPETGEGLMAVNGVVTKAVEATVSTADSSEYYETLQAAFEAAATMTGPVTVTLLKDIGSEAEAVSISIPECNDEITFDMGGFKVVGGIDTYYSAKVTIKNGTIESYNSDYPIHAKKGHIVLRDITLWSKSAHGVRLEGSEDSRITCEIYSGNYDSNGSGYTIYARNYSDLIIYGGTFTDGTHCVNVQSTNTGKIYGGSFTGIVYAPVDTQLMMVYGGKFTGTTYLTLGTGYGYTSKDSEGFISVVKADYALTVNAENATVSALNATYQYEDEVSFTVTPAAGYKVTSVKLGEDELTADEDGNYSFSMPAKAATITVTTEAASTFDVMIGDKSYDNAEALKAEAKAGVEMTIPATGTWTAEGNVLKKDGEAYVTFADYYTVVVNGTSVTLKLNKPVIGDSAEGADDAFTVTADAVTIKITNYNSALKYGVRIAADINSLSSAEITVLSVANGNITEDGVITLEKSGDSAFYEVVVSDVDFPTTSAE